MARGAKDYPVPKFLRDIHIDQEKYGKWLDRLTNAHISRDRKRFVDPIKPLAYRKAIHDALWECAGADAYTGEKLDFLLLEGFAGLKIPERDETVVPTLDHVILSATKPKFKFCSLRTNKCKSDLTEGELVDFAKKIVAFHESHKSKSTAQ